MPSNRVYSCSMPNQVSCFLYFSATSRHAARVFDGCGSPLTRYTSHRTSLLSPPRSGSAQVKTGLSTQSDRSPVACWVLDPSKPQIGGSSPAFTTLAFERSLAVGEV